MSQPAARLVDMTATGDPILPPCAPTVHTAKLPQACLGDQVIGPVMTGAIARGSATMLVGGRPAARMGGQVVGVHSISGAPLTQVVSITGAPTVLIGG